MLSCYRMIMYIGGVASQNSFRAGGGEATAKPARQGALHELGAFGTAMQHEHHLLLHLAEAGGGADPLQTEEVPPWRMRERIKTSSLVLVMALNLGVDPPDVIKPTPCARLECAPCPPPRLCRRALPAAPPHASADGSMRGGGGPAATDPVRSGQA